MSWSRNSPELCNFYASNDALSVTSSGRVPTGNSKEEQSAPSNFRFGASRKFTAFGSKVCRQLSGPLLGSRFVPATQAGHAVAPVVMLTVFFKTPGKMRYSVRTVTEFQSSCTAIVPLEASAHFKDEGHEPATRCSHNCICFACPRARWSGATGAACDAGTLASSAVVAIAFCAPFGGNSAAIKC